MNALTPTMHAKPATQPHQFIYVIFTFDAEGNRFYADLEGEPCPTTMQEVAASLVTQANLGVDRIEVRRMHDNADVTDEAITQFAYQWPNDMPRPDFLTDSYHGQSVMRTGAV